MSNETFIAIVSILGASALFSVWIMATSLENIAKHRAKLAELELEKIRILGVMEQTAASQEIDNKLADSFKKSTRTMHDKLADSVLVRSDLHQHHVPPEQK